MTIWKYLLTNQPHQQLWMPLVRLLSCAVQEGRIAVWALVVPDERIEQPVIFRLIRTGEAFPVEAGVTFLGTVQIQQASDIGLYHLSGYHVFYEVLGP